MQLKRAKVFALAWALILFGSIFQLTTSQAQTVALPPSMDCKLWPKIRNDTPTKAMVKGYLSGMSVSYWLQHTSKVGEPGLNPLGAVDDINDAYTWIDGYCAKNQKETLIEAMTALFFELEARQRLRTINR